MQEFSCATTMRMAITGIGSFRPRPDSSNWTWKCITTTRPNPHRGALQHGRRAPRSWNCGSCTGSGDHHGRPGRTARGNRHKVAAALVGTFLGILLCYGLVGPLAANMAKAAEEERCYLHVLRVLMISFLKGSAPIMAVEFGRRAIPGHLRPSFQEVEKTCRGAERSSQGCVRIRHRHSYGIDPTHHYQEEGRAWRPPWRCLESRLCGLRHRHDGAVYRSLAHEQQPPGAGSDWGIFQGSFR
jgi:hypothetical protein